MVVVSVAAALALGLAAPAPPGDPGPVTALVLDEAKLGDLDDLLHVVRRSGRVTLAADAPAGRLAVEFYAAGKKDDRGRSIGYDVTAGAGQKREVEFAVQAADLDHLPLGGGAKGHSRLLLKVRAGGMVAATTFDVPKGAFDFSRGVGGGAFPAKAGTADEVPLFWLVAGTNHVKSGSTPQQVVENHTDAQVAVFYLRLGKGK